MMYIKLCWQMATLIVYSRFTYLELWGQQRSFPTTSETFRTHPSPVTLQVSPSRTQQPLVWFGLRKPATYSLWPNPPRYLILLRKNENTSILVAGGDDGNSIQSCIHSGLSLVHCHFNIKYLYVKGMSFPCQSPLQHRWALQEFMIWAWEASRPLCKEVFPQASSPQFFLSFYLALVLKK